MALSKIAVAILMIFFITDRAQSRSKLPIIATKQSVDNIRYLVKNGKYTYYQRRSGDLLVSSNYHVKVVVKGEIGYDYTVVASPAQRRILIAQDRNYHHFINPLRQKHIFVADIGGTIANEIGKGVVPRIHLDDTWASFYNPDDKTLHFVNLINDQIKFEVKIYNRLNPYFVPEVVMPNQEVILFTDLNSEGVPGIVKYDRKTKKLSTFYKGESYNEKIELCLGHSKLYIGQFSLAGNKNGSLITQIDTKELAMDRGKPIYDSELNDPGAIICDTDPDKLYFSKELKKGEAKLNYEIVEFSVPDKKIEILSDLEYATQAINMDGIIVTHFRGLTYVLVGQSNLKSDQIKAGAAKKGETKAAPEKAESNPVKDEKEAKKDEKKEATKPKK